MLWTLTTLYMMCPVRFTLVRSSHSTILRPTSCAAIGEGRRIFARRRARIRKEGAEAVLKLCGGPPDSKGLPFGGGRSARASEGGAIQISVDRKGLR